MKIKANLILPPIKELEKATGLNEGGKVQKYIDSFVFNHSEKYLPKLQRNHIHVDSINANKFGSGQVIWNTPDANYLYEGKLMVDELTHSSYARKGTQKIMDPKNRDLSNVKRKKDHWFDRMIDTEMKDLVKGIENIVNGGNNG